MPKHVALSTLAAMAMLMISSALVIILHIQNPEFDPITRPMSDYMNGRYGLLMVVSLSALGLGMLALANAFRGIARSTPQRGGAILLTAAGLSTLIAGSFTADNVTGSSFNTTHGAIHSIAALLLSPLVVAAMLCLSGPFNEIEGNQALQRLASALAILSSLALVALLFVNFIIRVPISGLGQRIFLGLGECWFGLMSVRLLLFVMLRPMVRR